MARTTSIKRESFIPIPKDMNKLGYKIIIIAASDGQSYDVTNYVTEGNLQRIATVGVSNFAFMIDNNNGRYKGKFAAADVVDIYYDYKDQGSLSTIRFRGIIDGVFDNMDGGNGFTLSIEGRGVQKSSNNEHFVDTHITLQFVARNTLDCWFGTEGVVDDEANYIDGVLYNSGLIFKVYDTVSASWKVWKDLTSTQRETIKAQTGYTQTNTETYVEKPRITISQSLASEGDYEFRLYYDSGDEKWYFMVHPEGEIINTKEHATIGQNIISISRFGEDTLTVYNRVMEKGKSDGSILLMKTEENTTNQAALWIRDKKETTSELTSFAEVEAKAEARIDELGTAIRKGTMVTCGLPTLEPAEKIHFSIPYIFTGYLIVKTFTVSFGTEVGLEFILEIKEKETTFAKLFKDRIDENVNVTTTDNPNGMRNGIVYDFSDSTDYVLDDAQIVEEVLSLKPGEGEGTCHTELVNLDSTVSQAELRISAGQYWNCTYRISLDNGETYTSVTPGTLITFETPGTDLIIEIKMRESNSGVSPQFDKINFIYKE